MGSTARATGIASLLVSSIACSGGPVPPGAGSSGPALENGSFTEEIAGRTLHYEVHGEGPVLMTVPNSWGLSLDGLRGLFRPLEERMTLVYFDPRGLGGSGPVREPRDMGLEAVREDFHALRERLGLETVHAIGWSNGAMNLLLLAAERPETLRSAIVVHGMARFAPEDMAAIGERHPELFRAFGALQAELAASDEPAAAKTARMKSFWLEQYFPEMTGDRTKAAARIREAFGPAQFSYEHALYNQTTYSAFDARPGLAKITAPVLVIAGRHDMMPIERGAEIADGIAGARLEVFENSGHFAPLEEPDRFYPLVRSFVAEADRRE